MGVVPYLEVLGVKSGKYLPDDIPVNIGQAAFQAVVVLGQALVIQSQEVQDGRIEIPDGGSIDGRPASECIGFPVTHAAPNARAHHPEGEGIGIMVSPRCALLMSGHAPKFGAPEDERVFKQTPLFEVGEQGGGGLVEDGAMAHVVGPQRFMRIPIEETVHPAGPGSTVEIDITNAPFQEAAGKQAVAGVGRQEGVPGIRPVERVDVGGFGLEFTHLGRAQLHACRQLVGGDAGLEIGFMGAILGVFPVQEREKAAGVRFLVRSNGRGALQISDGTMGRQGHRLVPCRQKPIAPVGLPIGRLTSYVLDGDVGRKILVVAP